MLTQNEIDRQKKEQEQTDRYYQSLLFYESVDDCEIHLTSDGFVRIMNDPYEGNVLIKVGTFKKIYESLGILLQVVTEKESK